MSRSQQGSQPAKKPNSQMENIAKHQEDIAKETEKMIAVVQKSVTGSAMMDSSNAMAMSEEMQGLMQNIGSPSVSENDQFLMGQYLQSSPEDGLVKFGNYLQGVANDPKYADRKAYCEEVKAAALALHNAPVFKEYVKNYRAFEQDTSEEAMSARQAMEEMQNKVRQWMEG